MKKQVIPEPERVRELLDEHLQAAGEAEKVKLVQYYMLLIERNNVMNLTAVTDPEGVVTRHFADSLLALEMLPHGARVIDVGTGAGLPGIPLLIMRPDIEMTLLDSLNKRIGFLSDVISRLGLSARLIHARAEDAAQTAVLRESFDIALSRAVAELRVVSEWTLPFVCVGGSALMYKGPGAERELADAENALKLLNGTAELIAISTSWGERSIVRVEKTAPTPAKYPRRAGSAERAPL